VVVVAGRHGQAASRITIALIVHLTSGMK
jgi:hypothetical protein